MAESRGWITLDPGLVHGGPGKHLVGNSALALSVQLEAGRGECLGGGGMLGLWVGAGELVGGRALWKRYQSLGGWWVTELSVS